MILVVDGKDKIVFNYKKFTI